MVLVGRHVYNPCLDVFPLCARHSRLHDTLMSRLWHVHLIKYVDFLADDLHKQHSVDGGTWVYKDICRVAWGMGDGPHM